MNPVWLATGSLLFTTTAYYLLKNYLVEWGCKRFLRGRVRLDSDKKKESQLNGHTHAANGEAVGQTVTARAGDGDTLKYVSKGDMAEVSQL